MESSGLESLDTFLEGGVRRGDNVVWLADERGSADPFLAAFLAAGRGVCRTVHLGRRSSQPGASPSGGEDSIVLDQANPAADLAEVEAALFAADLVAGSRVVIDALDDLVIRWGAAAAIKFYRRTCPRLFDRGTIAYWVGSRDVVGAAVIDGVSKVAQCVFDVRGTRLRVAKAEGRSARLQGAVVGLEVVDGQIMVSREHAVGRIGEGLRRVRRDRNLTQAQIANLAGVTAGAISQAESGRRGLSLDSLIPLCEALGIGVDEILGTGRTPDPLLARHDREMSTGQIVPLFDDPAGGHRTFLVRLGPGESIAPPFPHKGSELILVAKGLVLVDLGDTTPVLRTGDALAASRVPVLRWTNLDDDRAELFWIALTPT
jgi:transcriptional regulator with XRE-family HTH domain